MTSPERSEAAELMTAAQVAERWGAGITAAHVLRLARDGKLPVVKLGRYRRFRRDQVEAFEKSGGTP